jgi:TRAP-type C4-dicarboxylate transport system substrate-binding protein
MKKLLFLLLVLCLMSTMAVSILSCSKSETKTTTKTETATTTQTPIVLKMVSFMPDNPPGNTFTHILMDNVKKKSNGMLTIEWAGGPEAMAPPDQPAAVQAGIIDMANTNFPSMPTPADAAICVNQSDLSMAEWRTSGVNDLIQELVSKINMYWLGPSMIAKQQDNQAFWLTPKVEKLADFKGLKLATTGFTEQEFIKALGGEPVPVNLPEMFTAMERGVVDGYFTITIAVFDFGLQDVSPYCLDEWTELGGVGYVINLDKWKSIPKNLQDILIESQIEMEKEGLEVNNKLITEYRQKFIDAGGQFIKLSAAESTEFRRIHDKTAWDALLARYPEYAPKFKAILDK